MDALLERLDPRCHAFELVYAPDASSCNGGQLRLLRTSVTRLQFEKLAQIAKRHWGNKPSYKKLKCYRIDAKIMEISADASEDAKVLEHSILDAERVSSNPQWIWVSCVKEKLAYHMFPCTLQLHDVYLVERMVYRLHHRVFLNFERQTYLDNESEEIYKVYINYNHDDTVDRSSILTTMMQALRILQGTLESTF